MYDLTEGGAYRCLHQLDVSKLEKKQHQRHTATGNHSLICIGELSLTCIGVSSFTCTGELSFTYEGTSSLTCTGELSLI